MDNKTLRKELSKTTYVILIKRDGVIKGISNKWHLKNHTECTVVSNKMKRFSKLEDALKYYEDRYKDDPSMDFERIGQLTVSYSLN